MIAEINIYAFLTVMLNLKAFSQQSILKLAERFIINPESFALLISVAVDGGAYYEN